MVLQLPAPDFVPKRRCKLIAVSRADAQCEPHNAVTLWLPFLTPPFGFALFYLRGVAPKEVTTGHIYRGIIPFVLIQVMALGLLALFPSVVTILPNLIGN
jgi:hypothetical protein